MIDLEFVDKHRFWEQYTPTGRKNTVNYGKILSYLNDVRKIQEELGCGRVYTSTYLGVEPKPNTPEKEYILVIELLPARGATYANQPISHIRFEIGKRQVILRMRDLQTKRFHKVYIFNCESAVETVSDLLEHFYEHGLMPIISSDYYFGQYKPNLQYVYNNIVERLEPEEVKELKGLLKSKDFEFFDDMCKKSFGNFKIRIYQKNKYGSYILAFQDLEEKASIHWALKGKDLVGAVDAIMKIYERWVEDIRGTK